jgi:Glycosyltransferase family 87
MALKKYWPLGNLAILVLILAHSIYRDIRLEKQFPPDLRNRVVGSRLQKDGKLPYNYYWQPPDGIRYYDFANVNTSGQGISNITASPFFHQLLMPLAELGQRTVSRVWLCLQYLLLALMTVMFCISTRMVWKKWLILNLGIVFTTTEAWIVLINSGQIYLFEAFLISGIIFNLLRKTNASHLWAGLFCACFVLTRPIALVIFIPFFMYARRNAFFLVTTFASLAVYGLFVLTNPYERSLYKNYYQAVKMHAVAHLQEPPDPQYQTPAFRNMEGFNFDDVSRLKKKYPRRIFSEYGNVFVIYNRITHHRISMFWLNFCSAAAILFLSGIFFVHSRKFSPQPLQYLILAFILYMIVELFSPIRRPQYNTVQWLPLLFSAVLYLSDWKNPVIWLLLAGLFLNIINISWLPMRHTLGEYLWLFSLLVLVFSRSQNPALWKKQS